MHRHRARFDPLPEQAGHVLAVVASIGETLGIDERVHRLVDERPGETPVAERAPRVRRDDGLEAFRDASRVRRGGAHGGHLAL